MKKKSDETPPLEVVNFYKELEDYIRSSFGEEPLLAMAHIHALDGHREIVACPFNGDESKTMFSDLVRKKCRDLDATMVGFFSECYSFDNIEDHNDYSANRAKYKYSFGNHPNAIEALMIQIETRDGSYLSKIPILKGRKLGETKDKLIKLSGHSGRMKFL